MRSTDNPRFIRISPALLLAALAATTACGSEHEKTTVPAMRRSSSRELSTPTVTSAAELPSVAAALPAPGAAQPAPPDVAAPPADAERTAGGVASKVLKAGTGEQRPRAWDVVKVHYTGWTSDGKEFDSSRRRPGPAELQLTSLIPGLSDSLQQMVAGEQRRLWVPENLAYRGAPGAPMGTLVFDVELIDITRLNDPPATPKDVAQTPVDAERTESGIAWKRLKTGTGKVSPGPEDVVELHYTGWTSEGRLFDSTITRGEPMTMPLKRAMPGWNEGLKTMVIGERRRFWIPAERAYKDRRGPQGTLVFDLELLDIMGSEGAPVDVSAPPPEAKRMASGLAYRVLRKGRGGRHPNRKSRVALHYAAWTADGRAVDSTYERGAVQVPLTQVIPGWVEGLERMTVGEKTRLWVPEKLAQLGDAKGPPGDLVFDLELLEILE